MTHSPDHAERAEVRTIASLTRLERQWCKRRYCGWCEAPLLGDMCYAQSGKYALPVIKGVRDREETIDLGPSCNMDERRAAALQHYKPRAALHDAKEVGAQGCGEGRDG